MKASGGRVVMNSSITFFTGASEDWFLDLPQVPDPRRTRDWRYYRREFGSNAFAVARRDRDLPVETIEAILRENAFLTIANSGGFDGRKEALLLAHLEAINALARCYPGKLRVGILGEVETQVYHVLPPSATPADACLKYKRLCFEYGAGVRRDRITRLLNRIETATLRELQDAVYGIHLDPGLHIVTVPDKAWGVHLHFAWGADAVHLERSGWNDNAQLAIAFLRGAARQYGKAWALDMSPWGGSHTCGRGPTTYDATGLHVAGVSASLHEFTWVSSLLAGAEGVSQQASECTFFRLPDPTRFGPSNCDTLGSAMPLGDGFRKQDPGAHGAVLSPVGEKARHLQRLVHRPDFDRGRVQPPVALMVPLDHGWDAAMFTRENGVWGGTVPLARGDQLLTALFECFLPGYRRAGRMMDPAFNPAVPFSSEQEMMERMYAGFDIRPLEEGIFVPTPYGDAVDVVTDEIADEKLAVYDLVIPAGRLVLDAARLAKLRRYVEQGGQVLLHSFGIPRDRVAASNAVKQAREFAGIDVLNDYLPGYCRSRLADGEKWLREGKYEYMHLALDGADTVVLNEEGHSLVTEHRVGSGRVLFDAVYHHLTLTGRDLIEGVKALLDRELRALLPVSIAGAPIQYQVNRIAGGYLVGLFNWSASEWTGRVTVRSDAPATRVEELCSASATATNAATGGTSFAARVAPYGIGMYRCVQ